MGELGGVYSLAECARLLREPRETVREWTVKGLAPTRRKGERVSPAAYEFTDLISLLVVARLRARGVPLHRIRTTEEYLRQEVHLDRPLATTRLYTDGRDILVRLLRDGETRQLVAASRYGQGAIAEAFESVLSEVQYRGDIAAEWCPWNNVRVNPRRQFGAPCVAGTGIQTGTLYRFVAAGDSPEAVARVYSLPLEYVLHAVEWEEQLAASTRAKAA